MLHKSEAALARVSVAGCGSLSFIDDRVLAAKTRDARASGRLRSPHLYHTSPTDPFQRMLNAIEPGSYVRPHAHRLPPRAEAILVLRGSIAFVGFSSSGAMLREGSAVVAASLGTFGVDCDANTMHTFFALETGTVVFEAKAGPYDAALDKAFAAWAPAEGTLEGQTYLANIEDHFRSWFGLESRTWSPGVR